MKRGSNHEGSAPGRAGGAPPLAASTPFGWLSPAAAEPLIEEHRRVLLARTNICAWVVAGAIPIAIGVAGLAFHPGLGALAPSLAAELGVVGLLVGLRRGAFRRRHQLAFFLLAAACVSTEASLLGPAGLDAGPLRFAGYLILFGIAVLFPASSSWAVTAAALVPLGHLASRLQGPWRGAAPPGELLELVGSAFVAAVANRVATRIFFREAESRLALEAANRRLQELDVAKTSFFANVSHDLRSPLTLILGSLRLLHGPERLDEARRTKYLDVALRGATRLEGMLNDILDLARIDSGMGRLQPVRVAADAIVAELVESMVPHATSLGLALAFDPPGAPLMADLDVDKFERIVSNLLSNGCKYSREGGAVVARLWTEGDTLALAVRDLGEGIAPEDLPTIFGRFSRGREDDRGRTRGTGLGLAVVREFAELHGGRVEVESVLGEGSVFTVRLPRWQPGSDPCAIRGRLTPVPGTLAAPGIPKPRLLLVEDSSEAQLLLGDYLGRSYEVASVASGEEAVARVERESFDVGVFDVMLPGMDGLEACRKIRGDPGGRRFPILVYTARADPQLRQEALGAGADDFLPKPFQPSELSQRLARLLRRAARAAARPEARAQTGG